MSQKIAIIDYGFGNIKSIINALKFCSAEYEVINSPEKISNFGGAVLPGVGAFGPASVFLRESGFDISIRNYVKSGKMLFGICLGFQLFFAKSYENGMHEGLGLIEGEVKKFELSVNSLKVPHIGWNNVEITETSYAKKMFSGIANNEKFYFVHSYYALPEDKRKVSGFCGYGTEFCSSVAFENVWGSQFHAEKSGDKGLKIISNFINEVNK